MLPIRLAVMPVIVWLFMHLVTKDVSLINICTIGAGMPVASLVAMGAAPVSYTHLDVYKRQCHRSAESGY